MSLMLEAWHKLVSKRGHHPCRRLMPVPVRRNRSTNSSILVMAKKSRPF
jgi:hypothetical protein